MGVILSRMSWLSGRFKEIYLYLLRAVNRRVRRAHRFADVNYF